MDKGIIRQVARELELPEALVERTYNAFWRVVREHMASQPFKNDLSDEEFDALKPNVNIPSIGKMYVTRERYKYLNESYKNYIREKNAAHQED